jgi:hypothetical protein
MGAKKVSSDSGGDKKRIETAYREFGEYSLGRKSVTIPPSGPWLRKRTWWHGSGGISMAISGLSCGMWPCAFWPSHPLPHLARETGLHMTSSTTSGATSLRSRVLMTWSMCCNLRLVAASVNPDASRKNAGAHNIADAWDVEAGDFQSEEDEMDPEVGDDDIDYGSTDMSSDEGLDGDSADEVESDAGDASECGHGGSDSLSESGEGELPSDLGEDNGDHGDNLSESEDGSMDIDR